MTMMTKEIKLSTRSNGARHSDKSKEVKMQHPHNKAARTSREAISNRVVQNVTETYTSTIIPVWVSATSEPDREVLVYVLLDT